MQCEHVFMFCPYEKKEYMCIAGVSQSKKKVIVSLTIIRKPHKHCAHMFSNNVQIKDKKNPHAHPVHGGLLVMVMVKSH